MMAIRHRSPRLTTLLILWCVGTTFGAIWNHGIDLRPGSSGHPAPRRPAESKIHVDPGRPTLLVFLHPKCPCSRASMTALVEAFDRLGTRVSVHIVQFEPSVTLPSWGPSVYESSLSSRKSIRIDHDPGGIEAKRFGVDTSGHALLFDSSGVLLFSGGMTGSRASTERNEGAERLIAIVDGRAEPSTDLRYAVFGCPLETPSDGSNAEAS